MAVARAGTPLAPALTPNASLSSGTNTGTVTGNWNSDQPRTAGHLLVAYVTAFGGTTAGTIAESSGTWTKLNTAFGTKCATAIFTLVATGGDAAPTFTCTMTGTASHARMMVVLDELSGQDSTTPAIGVATAAGTSAALTVTSAAAAPDGGCWAAAVYNYGSTTSGTLTHTPGSGWTNLVTTGATSTYNHLAVDSVTAAPGSGTTPSDAAVHSGTATTEEAAVIVVVQDPQAAPPSAAGTLDITGTASAAAPATAAGSVTLSGTAVAGYRGVVLADSPSVYYRLGDTAAPAVPDAGAGGVNAAMTGTVTFGQTGALAGDADTACSFPGTSGYLQTAASPGAAYNFGDGPLSIEFWFKQAATGVLRNAVTKGTSGYIARISATNKLILRKSGATDIFVTTAAFTDTTGWHHVVATRNGTGSANTHIYVDGVDQAGVYTEPATGIADTTTGFTIGADAAAITTGPWNGLLDEVALYPSALTQARVTAHYQAGAGSPGAAVAAGSLSVTGTASAAAPATAAGSLSIAGTAAATAPATAAGSVTLSGAATAAAPVTAAGGVSVAGTATATQPGASAAGALSVTGTATAAAPATAAGSVTLSGSTAAQAAVTATAAIAVTGTAAAAGPATATGTVTMTGAATARAPTSAAGSLSVAGTGTAAGPGTTAAGTLTLAGAGGAGTQAAASGLLAITGAAAPKAPAAAAGTLALGGTAASQAPAAASGGIAITATATATAAGATIKAASAGTVTAQATSVAAVTDPRDGTTTVTGATSTATVS